MNQVFKKINVLFNSGDLDILKYILKSSSCRAKNSILPKSYKAFNSILPLSISSPSYRYPFLCVQHHSSWRVGGAAVHPIGVLVTLQVGVQVIQADCPALAQRHEPYRAGTGSCAGCTEPVFRALVQ